jgi:hypothetical protein
LSHSRQPGQTSAAEVQKRDLRADLLAAEQEAKNKKRKAEGKPPLPVENGSMDEEVNKRRKLLQEALELDKDDDEDDDEDEEGKEGAGKDKDEDEAGDRYELLLNLCGHHGFMCFQISVMKTLTMMKMTRLNFSASLRKSNVNGQRRRHGRRTSSLPRMLQLEKLRLPQEILFST